MWFYTWISQVIQISKLEAKSVVSFCSFGLLSESTTSRKVGDWQHSLSILNLLSALLVCLLLPASPVGFCACVSNFNMEMFSLIPILHSN